MPSPPVGSHVRLLEHARFVRTAVPAIGAWIDAGSGCWRARASPSNASGSARRSPRRGRPSSSTGWPTGPSARPTRSPTCSSDLGLDPPREFHDALVDVFTDPSPEHDPLPDRQHRGAASPAAGGRRAHRDHLRCRASRPSRTLRALSRWARPARLLRPLVVLRRGRHVQAGPGDLPPRPRRAGRRRPVAARPTSATSAAPTSPVRKALGITAVRYTGVFDDPGSAEDGTDRVEGDHVLVDHAELAAALGLG